MTQVKWMSEKSNKLESLSSNLDKSTRLPQSLLISYPSVFIISDYLKIRTTKALEEIWIRVAVQTVDLCERGSFWVPLSSGCLVECGRRYFGSQRQFASCCPASLCWGQIPVTSWLSLSYHDCQTLFPNKFLGNYIHISEYNYSIH